MWLYCIKSDSGTALDTPDKLDSTPGRLSAFRRPLMGLSDPIVHMAFLECSWSGPSVYEQTALALYRQV